MGNLFSTGNFNDFVIHYGYWGIFLFFITVDQLTPIPEEVTLLGVGYLSANGFFNPVLAAVFALAAFLLADTVYFILARSGNRFFMKHFGNKPLLSRYTEKLKSNPGKTLIVLCFIPRMRMFGPIVMGLLKTRYRKFILFDLLGLSFFTVIYLSLGMIFHAGLHSLIAEWELLRHLVFGLAILIAGLLIFLFLIRNKHAKA